jgi:hypothetical protein
MMIEAFKRQDGEGLGANKVGGGSGENIPEPPKTHHKNDFPPKPNHLRNRLDTTPAPPVFPTPTNDLQKPIKFVSTSGKVFFGKESEKASEEKLVEKSSGEKPSEQPQSKPKPKLVRFHCGYCGRDGHKDEFCFKRKREERMAKEWANKDKYHPSSGVLEPRVQMPRAKASVRTVPAWGERKAAGGVAGGVKPVRPVWVCRVENLVFVLVRSLGLSQVVVVLVLGLESQQVVSLLGILPLVLNTGTGGVIALRWRGGTIHGSPFVVLVLLQAEKVGFFGVVTEVVFVVVVLVRKMVWCALTPLSGVLLLFNRWGTICFLCPSCWMRVLRCCFGLVVLRFWTLEGTLSVWSFPRVRCFVLIFLSLRVWSVVSWLVLRVSCGGGIGSWVT